MTKIKNLVTVGACLLYGDKVTSVSGGLALGESLNSLSPVN